MTDKNFRLPIVFDFDGIMSGGMYFGKLNDGSIGKTSKQLQYDVRQCIDMLSWFDCDVYVLSGDSSEHGRKLTKGMLQNCKCKVLFCDYKSKLLLLSQLFGDLSKIVYVADNLNDILIAPQIGTFITTKSALQQLKDVADYVTEQDYLHYAFLDICDFIVKKVINCRPEWFIQQTSYNDYHPLTILSTFNIKKLFIIGNERYSEEIEKEAFDWFDKNMLMIFGKTIKQLQENYIVQYKHYLELDNRSRSFDTMSVIMTNTMLNDIGQFMYLPKTLLNFNALDIDNAARYNMVFQFMSNMQNAIKVLPTDEFKYKQTFAYMPYDFISKLNVEDTFDSSIIAFIKSAYCSMPKQTTLHCTATV